MSSLVVWFTSFRYQEIQPPQATKNVKMFRPPTTRKHTLLHYTPSLRRRNHRMYSRYHIPYTTHHAYVHVASVFALLVARFVARDLTVVHLCRRATDLKIRTLSSQSALRQWRLRQRKIRRAFAAFACHSLPLNTSLFITYCRLLLNDPNRDSQILSSTLSSLSMSSLADIVPPGVVTGDNLLKLLTYAKDHGFAIPAFNCTR